MDPDRHRSVRIVAAAGLGVGALFGLGGTLVESAPLRQLFWTIDGVALVVASALLTVMHFRQGEDLVASGFLVFGIGEGVIVSGNAAGLEGSLPSFGGGVALWAAALLLTSVPRRFATWVRIAGVVAAILFAIVAVRIVLGHSLLPTSAPLPFYAFPVLIVTFVGWILALFHQEGVPASSTDSDT
jgi:hypothetical protein